ncbi:MAG: NAD(P)/FAD-dependent oxidoreductase [Myxococcota bacterium]
MPDGSHRSPPTTVLVAILGAGFAGLGMAIRLRRAGIHDFLVLERGSAVGGTWRDNTYPGAACDIPSHLYSYSFELNPQWSHVYGRQAEIREYLERCTDRYGLRPRIRLGAEVIEARFDERQARWHLHTRDGRHVIARFVVHAIGALKDPRVPSLPGQELFEGPAMHSARWDHAVDFRDQRVGVIGTGASAIQIVPELAKIARHITVFQRTPPWVVPRQDRPYTTRQKRRFARFPALMRLHRWAIYSAHEIRHPLLFGKESRLTTVIERNTRRSIEQAFSDPAEARALTPRYRMGCKRLLVSDDWYPTLALRHVEVRTAPITEIRRHDVVLADGHTQPLDALIYCTGFTVDRPLGSMKVYGRGGRELSAWWGPRPRAYLGLSVPHFPNAFMLLGPNSGLGHNSVLLMLEAQLEHTLRAIDHVLQRPEVCTIEAEPAALERFVDEIDDEHAGRVWQSGCQSWYLGANGANYTLWPGSTVSYIVRTRRFDPRAYREQRYGEIPAARPLVTAANGRG